MSKKDVLKEELSRIQQIMGVNDGLLMEGPVPIPKSFIKKILKDSDDVGEVLTKLFNLSDNQIDNIIAQIDRLGVDNLSDDVLEALARTTIDNVDDFVRLLKAGKYLGSNFDEISIRLMDRVEGLGEITPQTRQKVIDLYKEILDELPFLENAKEIKEKLVRDFQSEFDSKFADRLIRTTSDELDKRIDDLLRSGSIVDDIPEGEVSEKTREMIAKNEKNFKDWIKQAKKKGSYLKRIDNEEYKFLMDDAIRGAKRIGEKTLDELKRIDEIEPSWWSKLPLWKKVLTVISTIGLAPTAGALLWYSTLARFSNWGDITWIKKIFSGATGELEKLSETNVENWFKETHFEKWVDSDNFKDNFSINFNQPKTEAVIQANDGSEEWEVKIQDNKIVQKLEK